MPNIAINVGKPVSDEQKNALQLAIGASMPILPTKTIDNTTIQIRDGISMFRGGAKIEGAFMDIRLFGVSPEDAKAEFCARMAQLLESHLDIEPKLLQINFLEMEHWGGGNGYR